MSSFESRFKARRKAQLTAYAQGMRRSGTSSEQALWESIRSRALGVQFRRQVPVGGSFIADYLASEVRLIVEVDGTWHDKRQAADMRRDRKLERLGYTILRLPAALVEHHLPLAVQCIRDAIAQCRSQPSDL